jgi:GntR family transcriptional regulator / MocR family aminotransferase
LLEITPILDNKSKKPLYIQLSDYIKQEITTGRIQSNEKLPSKRKLSQYLDVSVNTVQAAYDQLCAEGYVVSKQRKGLFVTSMKDDLFANQTYSQEWQTKNEQVYSDVDIDFNSGTVDLDHFPYTPWRKLTMQSLYEDQGELLYTGNPQGEIALREEISKYLYESRGVRCTADQIVIGAGTQGLIGLLCLIIGKESTYALENPGFHRTRAVLEDQSINTIPIPLDDDGIEVKALQASYARVVYVTPSHQFPYGMVMPIARRLELLKWAEEKGGYIIEDDYDGEFRYKGKPIPSLQGLDTNGNVIYLGTFSKSLIPSIRISYMVLPPTLIQRYQDHFTIYKQTVSRLHQHTLYRFMNEGHWQRHLNKMRTLYRKKQKTLMAAIHNNFRDQVNVIGEKSGLHIVLEIKKDLSEEELIKRAMKVGVKVYPISIYYDGAKIVMTPKILLGFGGLSEKEIEDGIRLLKRVWGI